MKNILNIFKNFEGQKLGLVPDDKMKEYLIPMSTPHFKTKEDLFEKAKEELKILSQHRVPAT
ncbi:MAG: hypothetical protein HOG03_06745 [Desulfobacula sp.]|jgi:hypothetical protein|uniref:hypothetical protein n=1 Tax=Desulfobacula sp. TaxID=2593537 RepID=UPI001DE8DA59|nr:hypothetical protein [Desulfobacula sp.]MBT3804283.1 hypothetical protein [Desulfobacula sp.]MBT4198169.1 hypothetical protein [Desulfobacula sp.]MBT4506986.1 hypothetical protein [Desulfobacula sp.]MBT5544433.1 hypothetical protein [Desulfobacula sp.]